MLQLPKRQRWAVEIKRSLSPALTKGFHLGCEDIQATSRWVVYPGHESFPLNAETQVIPLAQLVDRLREMQGVQINPMCGNFRHTPKEAEKCGACFVPM